MMKRLMSGLAFALMLASCAEGDSISRDTEPFGAISESEELTLLGNEPFWNIAIEGSNAVLTSPDDQPGTEFSVSRFAGNNGLGLSGELKGEAIQIAVTPGECSDGMSDRSYPYTATISWGERMLFGCGFTDSKPFTGGEAP